MARKMALSHAMLLAFASMLTACSAGKSDPDGTGENVVANSAHPERVYWGDTHLHTANSVDAFGFGNRLGPEMALRFARGEIVTSSTGVRAQLARPLDFLVIADHSDGLGVTRRLFDAPEFMVTDPTLRRWRAMMHESPAQSQRAIGELITAAATNSLPAQFRDPRVNAENSRRIWGNHLEIVERYNQPGRFTAFGGFEFSLMPNGNNLHRVVMFRDGIRRTSRVIPFGSIGDVPVERLWDYMDNYERTTGGRVLAIPHNGNLSNGLMFELTGPDGGPMRADYARRRMAHEPVVEATQNKGDSESHPFLSPNDEFAGFGDAGWDLGNLPLNERKTPDMFAGEYLREALKRGLTLEAQMGVNPYRFGLVGGTDMHTSLSTSDEDNFLGDHSGNEPSPGRVMAPQSIGSQEGRFGWNFLAGGYTGVWATSNTRAAIFDAIARREVYASTGPRMVVRMFGGFDFTPADFSGDWVSAGYRRGVPMGGELTGNGRNSAPTFLISALRDPIGANLDRVQMVKGWIDDQGATHEQIYDVAWSSPETRHKIEGRLTPVGNTVDLAHASYTNAIGAPELRTVWRDPDFQPGQRAFYYLRVLEIPTPRWVVYDAVRFGYRLPAGVDPIDQERAYSSPIWYNPAPVAPRTAAVRHLSYRPA